MRSVYVFSGASGCSPIMYSAIRRWSSFPWRGRRAVSCAAERYCFSIMSPNAIRVEGKGNKVLISLNRASIVFSGGLRSIFFLLRETAAKCTVRILPPLCIHLQYLEESSSVLIDAATPAFCTPLTFVSKSDKYFTRSLDQIWSHCTSAGASSQNTHASLFEFNFVLLYPGNRIISSPCVKPTVHLEHRCCMLFPLFSSRYWWGKKCGPSFFFLFFFTASNATQLLLHVHRS